MVSKGSSRKEGEKEKARGEEISKEEAMRSGMARRRPGG
jgi:hypothetical protein